VNREIVLLDGSFKASPSLKNQKKNIGLESSSTKKVLTLGGHVAKDMTEGDSETRILLVDKKDSSFQNHPQTCPKLNKLKQPKYEMWLDKKMNAFC